MQQLWFTQEVYLGNGMESDAMPTAIASYLTLSGFVITADGKTTDVRRKTTTNDAQKIFSVPGSAMAYALYGYTALGNDDHEDNPAIIDLGQEIEAAIGSLSCEKFADILTFGERLAQPVHEQLIQAKTKGLRSYHGIAENLWSTTILHVLIWGYCNGVPAEMDIMFWHRDEKLGKPYMSLMKNNNSKPRIWGSPEVWNRLLDPSDSRFAKFRLQNIHTPVERLSLSEAAKLGENYILACDSEEGRAADPYMCPSIGGRIHTASITPHAGFDWIIAPLTVSRLSSSAS